MKLSERIAQFKASRKPPPPHVAEIVRRGNEYARDSGATGLRVGKTVRLADRLARGPVVLSFYRGVW